MVSEQACKNEFYVQEPVKSSQNYARLQNFDQLWSCDMEVLQISD